MNFTIANDSIHIYYPDDMSEAEALLYMKDQLAAKPGMRLVELKIKIDGAEVLLEPHYDTIIRVRRITGYLSQIDNFNDAKKAEEKARVKHL